MARKSMASPSMAELAALAKLRRKSSPPSTMMAPKLPELPLSHTSQSQTAAKAAQEQDYLVQNQTLARNNSIMLSRIANLELKIDELVAENLLLKLRAKGDKIQLEHRLSSIETSVVCKFGEILEIFSSLRRRENLQENSKVTALLLETCGVAGALALPNRAQDDVPLKALREQNALMSARIVAESTPSPEPEKLRPTKAPEMATVEERLMESQSSSGSLQLTQQPALQPDAPSDESGVPEPSKVSPRSDRKSKGASKSSSSEETEQRGRSAQRQSIVPARAVKRPFDSTQADSERENKPEKKTVAEPQETMERSRRLRKEVDYKVSLKKKLRREAGLVTAVGNEPISRLQSPAPAPEPKRKPLSVISASTSNRRATSINLKPPGVTDSQLHKSSKEDDLSIFDFENVPAAPLKTYKRRMTLDPTRHGLLYP